MKFDLLEDIETFLERNGYDYFEYVRGCFDIAAKGERFFLIKILNNVDSFQESQARDLKILSKALSASPLIIGKRTRRENLKEDILYERFGIPVLTPETFKSSVNEDYPDRIRTRGGIFGKLDPDGLKKARKENGLTQRELAEKLGVSQKNVSEHEGGSERVNYSVVKLAEREFDEEIKKYVNPFEIDMEEVKQEEIDGKLKSIVSYMESAGFEINYTARAPPELIAKESVTLLSRFGSSEKFIKKWESKLSRFSELSEKPAFMVAKKECKSEEIPVLSKEELNSVSDSKELIKIVREKEENF